MKFASVFMGIGISAMAYGMSNTVIEYPNRELCKTRFDVLETVFENINLEATSETQLLLGSIASNGLEGCMYSEDTQEFSTKLLEAGMHLGYGREELARSTIMHESIGLPILESESTIYIRDQGTMNRLEAAFGAVAVCIGLAGVLFRPEYKEEEVPTKKPINPFAELEGYR